MRLICLLVGMVVAGPVWGQAPQGRVAAFGDAVGVVAPEATVGEALRALAAKSSAVFVGQVVAITRVGGVVEVRFRVDQSVVGSVGGEYVLREWAGLWPVGMERYVVGQRAMIFAAAPVDGVGLSSTVDGADGVVPVLVGDEPLLDVGRLEARVLRANGEALGDYETGAVRLSDAVALAVGRKLAVREPVRVPVPVRFRRWTGVRRVDAVKHVVAMGAVEVRDAR